MSIDVWLILHGFRQLCPTLEAERAGHQELNSSNATVSLSFFESERGPKCSRTRRRRRSTRTPCADWRAQAEHYLAVSANNDVTKVQVLRRAGVSPHYSHSTSILTGIGHSRCAV